jgi:DNA-binding CsgD family transcriptional regulator
MYLSTTKQRVLSQLMATLAEPHGEAEIRQRIGVQMLDLLDADYYASYVWDDAHRDFRHRVALNMSDSNLSQYETYYQFHDPITHAMRTRRVPTLAMQVMPQAELVRTEFFNDFLYRDGLYWGINLYAWEADQNIGDMRIWRNRRRDNFDRDAVELLEFIKPAFEVALRRGCRQESAQTAPIDIGRQALPAQAQDLLSERELEVARLLAMGLSDKVIAQRLGIGYTTVRSHVKHAFQKLGACNRVQLAQRLNA